MRKSDVISEVVKRTGIERNDVELILEASLSVIKKSVSKGVRVDFRGFGAFYAKKLGPKKARRPTAGNSLATSEVIDLPERLSPAFRPSKQYFKISISSDGVQSNQL